MEAACTGTGLRLCVTRWSYAGGIAARPVTTYSWVRSLWQTFAKPAHTILQGMRLTSANRDLASNSFCTMLELCAA